jgi:hypothetical protein
MSGDCTYHLLSICPAPGWRVVYLDGSRPGGWRTEALAGWGVFRVIYQGKDDDSWTEAHGLAREGTTIERAPEDPDFWYYLPPGEPEPTMAEARDERDQRRGMWGDPVPLTVEGAVFSRDHGDGWLLTVRFDDGRSAEVAIMIETLTPSGRRNTEGMGMMFARLAALGVPTGPPHGPVGERSWWDLGWDEDRVAQAMVGKRAMARRDYDDGWAIEPRLAVPQ